MGHASSFRPQRSSSDDTASARNNGRHNCRMLENQRGRWVCDLHVDVPELCAQLLQQVGVHQGGDGGAGFSFPIFYTMWNTFASFLGANLLMVLVPANRTISWKQFVDNKFALLVFGVVFSSNIVTNNASLVHISLSVNQVIKCLVPIPAIFFSYFIEKKTYSYPVLLSAGVLTFGACMSIPYDSPKVTLLGSVLALWSTC